MTKSRPTVKTDRWGTRYYLVDGKLHRTGGPAREYADGSKEWWLNGDLHRVDGPAVEEAAGGQEWYLAGNRTTS